MRDTQARGQTGGGSHRRRAATSNLDNAPERHIHLGHSPNVGVYARVFGFTMAASGKICEYLRAPSMLLRLELETLEERVKRLGLIPTLPPLFVDAAYSRQDSGKFDIWHPLTMALTGQRLLDHKQ